MLKGVLKNRKFHSSDEIKELMTKFGYELTFNEVQSIFHKWMSRLAWVTENGGILLNKYEMASSHVVNLKIGGAGNFLYTPYIHF
jgi:hypothetical protein